MRADLVTLDFSYFEFTQFAVFVDRQSVNIVAHKQPNNGN